MLLIRNGEIVTPETRYHADILCHGEHIAAIGHDLPHDPAATTVLDATGLLVLPGFVDPHTHIHLPFMGTVAADTYPTASRAALAGGATTLIDFVIPARHEQPLDALATWQAQASGQSHCDYSFHLAVTRHDPAAAEQIRHIVRHHGITSLKVFLAYKDAIGLPDDELFHTLALAHQLGATVAAHCEDATLIAQLQASLLAQGRTGPEWHHESRPPAVEAIGVHRLCAYARQAAPGLPLYIVHLSCAEALHQALAARAQGQTVHIETLIQHLVLDKTHAEQPDFQGAKYVMSPPLRDQSHHPVLWNALRTGDISVVATDHAPFHFATQKILGKHNFTLIPNGVPSLQHRADLLHTHGVLTGKIDLHQFVALLSANPARHFGLSPRKGSLHPGADADIVLYDPAHRHTISAATHHMAVDYSAFEGHQVTGAARHVILRGQPVVRDHQLLPTPPRGQFLPRVPA